MGIGRGRSAQTGKPPSDPPVYFRVEQLYGLSLTDTIPDETVSVRLGKNLIKAGIVEEPFVAALA